MPKQRSRTDPYTVRFGMDLQEPIEQAAAAEGLTPRVWLERTFEKALRKHFKMPAPADAPGADR